MKIKKNKNIIKIKNIELFTNFRGISSLFIFNIFKKTI